MSSPVRALAHRALLVPVWLRGQAGRGGGRGRQLERLQAAKGGQLGSAGQWQRPGGDGQAQVAAEATVAGSGSECWQGPISIGIPHV